jgi:hypothetical protein
MCALSGTNVAQTGMVTCCACLAEDFPDLRSPNLAGRPISDENPGARKRAHPRSAKGKNNRLVARFIPRAGERRSMLLSSASPLEPSSSSPPRIDAIARTPAVAPGALPVAGNESEGRIVDDSDVDGLALYAKLIPPIALSGEPLSLCYPLRPSLIQVSAFFVYPLDNF